jgi:hypothetical protein
MTLLVRLAALAIAIGALAPAAASAWMPDPVAFTRAVTPAAHAAGAAAATTVRTGRRFDLVGVEWRGARAARIELRAHRLRGGWSRWVPAGATDDGPDGSEGPWATGQNVGAPIWAGGADRVQLRVPVGVHGVRLRLLNTTGSASAAARARTRAEVARRGPFGARKVAQTNARAPRIVPRSAWGASKCKPRIAPAYGNVRVAYVHHTESLNGYSRAQAASIVLGVCLFHRNGRGWNDIGYNFLVDRYGVVYEGRAGGIDAPVLGAQAGGFNSESFGVSVIGSFTSSPPPRAAMSSLARLIAWKLSMHGISARGLTKVTSAGGGSTAYPAGTRVTVHRISGHRDVDQTSCPGSALYAQLPALRRTVARLEGAHSGLQITPRALRLRSGDAPTLGGVLHVHGGASAAGATVELRQLNGLAPETLLTTTTTAADGTWSVQLPAVQASAVVRAVFVGDAGRPGVTSPPVYLDVTPRAR